MVCVLQVGSDPNLLKTRAAVLESAGLRVICAGDAAEAIDRLSGLPIRAAILCHSLRPSERAAVAATVRRAHPGALNLLVVTGIDAPGAKPEGIDGCLDAHPQRMLAALRRLLGLPDPDAAPAAVSVMGRRPRWK